MSKQNGTILICPLNWGLGHATRDIPIIKRCLNNGFRVIVASEAPIIELLQKEIPNIETDYFPGAKITYSSGNKQLWKLLMQLPLAIYWLIREKSITARLVKKYKPVHIISDNRYGVRHSSVNSIIITHQLMLKMPKGMQWLEKTFHFLVKQLILRFSACWIPDNPMPNSLAGDLVHKYKLPKNALLIGPLSRFMDNPKAEFKSNHFSSKAVTQLLVLLSGPEPQRSILQNIISEKIMAEGIQSILVAGKPTKSSDLNSENDHLVYHNHLDTPSLSQLINTTPYIISRSGYTSIMDFWFTGRKAILVPTPGQTEQEYLATYHNAENHFSVTQDEIKQQSLLNIFDKFSKHQNNSSPTTNSQNALDKAIESLM